MSPCAFFWRMIFSLEDILLHNHYNNSHPHIKFSSWVYFITCSIHSTSRYNWNVILPNFTNYSKTHHSGVSKNNGTPKSSILIGFGTIINHPFWGTPIFGNTHFKTHLGPKKAILNKNLRNYFYLFERKSFYTAKALNMAIPGAEANDGCWS